jgi:hypothetical protein
MTDSQPRERGSDTASSQATGYVWRPVPATVIVEKGKMTEVNIVFQKMPAVP